MRGGLRFRICRFAGLAGLALLPVVTGGCASPPATASDPGAAWEFALEPLESPAAPAASAPQLSIEGARAVLSWLETREEGTRLRFAMRTASGWSEPRTVVSGDDLVVNSADVPSVRALADGTMVAHWLEEDGPDPEAYKLPLSWSRDEGRTWSPPVYPHHDGTQTQHGFASLFQAPGAGLGLVWLDGRGMDPEAPEDGTGDMALWAAVFDPDGSQMSEVEVDPRACECCQTSSAATSEGVIVAYRNRSEDEVRDIYVTRFVDGRWSEPALVHEDGWQISGCPVNGPAVSARGRDVAVAWFTVRDGEGQTLLALSRDGGRTFEQPVRVDEQGSLGHVDVDLLEDGSALVSWVEFTDGPAQFSLRRVDPAGVRSAVMPVADAFGFHYPRFARSGDELLFAWTAWLETDDDEGSTIVRTARAPAPGASGSTRP